MVHRRYKDGHSYLSPVTSDVKLTQHFIYCILPENPEGESLVISLCPETHVVMELEDDPKHSSKLRNQEGAEYFFIVVYVFID